jgi:hypothetical protein
MTWRMLWHPTENGYEARRRAGRRIKSQPAGTSQRYDLTPCHPGQARIAYDDPQLRGTVTVRVLTEIIHHSA